MSVTHRCVGAAFAGGALLFGIMLLAWWILPGGLAICLASVGMASFLGATKWSTLRWCILRALLLGMCTQPFGCWGGALLVAWLELSCGSFPPLPARAGALPVAVGTLFLVFVGACVLMCVCMLCSHGALL